MHCTVSVGDKLGTVRDTKNLYVYQMSLKRINCYHHSLWLSVNLVAKRIISYFRLIAFLLIFNPPPPRNLRVKLETSVFNLVVPILYYNIRFPQETFFSGKGHFRGQFCGQFRGQFQLLSDLQYIYLSRKSGYSP